MGALSPAESMEVEKMCAAHPEVAQEMARVQDAVNNYASAHARHPNPKVRTELLEKISKGGGKGKIRHLRNPYELTYKYLIAACIASLIISTFASVFFYQKWSEAEDRYVILSTEKNTVAQNLNQVKFEYDKLNHDMSVMRDPAITIVTLRAVDSTKYYMAHVMWNKYSKQTFIDVSDLPVPPAGQQYQLWALMEGQPTDAGVFDMTGLGMQKLKPVQAADMWAVTMEPMGGSVAPTMDQMVLLSKS
jgi:anti-sigma-K factor RskA